jgi:hypothetical protein
MTHFPFIAGMGLGTVTMGRVFRKDECCLGRERWSILRSKVLRRWLWVSVSPTPFLLSRISPLFKFFFTSHGGKKAKIHLNKDF